MDAHLRMNTETLENVLAVILGGGRGARLYPLTKLRSKPAVPIAGKYRLIDIPISNCINSGIYHIAVLTQFNSVSLHRHLSRTYNFDAFHKGWVQVLAAEQTIINLDWYQGTADAVRKQLFEIVSANMPYTLILAGDHLYRMDYAAMAQFHWQKNADITIAVQPIAKKDADRFGILKRNNNQRLTDFAEKPKDPAVLEKMISRDEPERPYLGSMGIYMFNTQVLSDLLETTTYDDFGGHVIPHAIHTHNVYGYDFDDYWEDIGTIRSFYDTNIALAGPNPPFSFYDAKRPIYSSGETLPSSIIRNSVLEDALISSGCIINHADITNSVIGVRSQIGNGTKIKDTVIMGADYYEHPGAPIENSYDPPLGIGDHCDITGAIIDKNTHVGDGVVIKPFPRGTDMDEENWTVRDGIVVIPKNAILLPNTYIGPK